MFKLKVWLRHYFGFSKKESNGFIVVIAILLITLSIPSFLRAYLEDNSSEEATLILLKADSVLPSLKTKGSHVSRTSLFYFDPNTTSEEDFLKLGLPSFLAKRIIKYREKGGIFKKEEDLAKIYGLEEQKFKELRPFIRIVPYSSSISTNTATLNSQPVKKNSAISVDINKADTSDLKKINGIGTVLASRIVKYRNKLGGFTNSEHLKEVYGLDISLVGIMAKVFKLEMETV